MCALLDHSEGSATITDFRVLATGKTAAKAGDRGISISSMRCSDYCTVRNVYFGHKKTGKALL